MGKSKNYYTPHLDTGDYVVIINAKDVILSGKKENQKLYRHHSNYPGGLNERSARQVRAKKPEDLIKHAVVGMLPKTKLARQMIKKLYIYPGSQHPYGDKKLITESTVEKQKAQNSVPSEPSRSIERGSPKATVASVITK